MFSLKLDGDLIEKLKQGVILDIGDKLYLEYKDWVEDIYTVVRVEEVTLKSIKHYNGDLFFVTFEEKGGTYAYALNQLLHFKYKQEKGVKNE